MLNTKDAIELYLMLKDFVPDYKLEDDFLEFTGTIVSNIRHSDKPEVFGQSILFMFPKIKIEKLIEMKPLKVVELFMEGLVENRFLLLCGFCEAIGYA